MLSASYEGPCPYLGAPNAHIDALPIRRECQPQQCAGLPWQTANCSMYVDDLHAQIEEVNLRIFQGECQRRQRAGFALQTTDGSANVNDPLTQFSLTQYSNLQGPQPDRLFSRQHVHDESVWTHP